MLKLSFSPRNTGLEGLFHERRCKITVFFELTKYFLYFCHATLVFLYEETYSHFPKLAVRHPHGGTGRTYVLSRPFTVSTNKYPAIRRIVVGNGGNSRIRLAHKACQQILILAGGYQLIALAVNVDNLYLVIVTQMLAQLGDVHVHAAGVEIIVVYPNGFQGIVTLKYLVGMGA